MPLSQRCGTRRRTHGEDPRARRPAGIETARVRRARWTGAAGRNPHASNRHVWSMEYSYAPLSRVGGFDPALCYGGEGGRCIADRARNGRDGDSGADADRRHSRRGHGDRPGRRSRRTATTRWSTRCLTCPGCMSARPAARAGRRACSSAAATRTRCWCCATACRSTMHRTRRRVQFRHRYAVRRRADRDHPRPDGGAVRLGGDRRRDQPDLPPRHRSGDALGAATSRADIRR